MGEFIEDVSLYFICIDTGVHTHTHSTYGPKRWEKDAGIYTITCVEGFKREDEYERRDDDMRSKTISYRRKKDITSREGKEERKNKEEHTVKAMPVT